MMTLSQHNTTEPHKPGIVNLVKCKCPRCCQGDMFVEPNPWRLKTTMKMNKLCPVCEQPLNIEVGFYYGSSYVSYALTVALSVATFIAWWVLIGFSFGDNRFVTWIVFNSILLLALQPPLMRLSRTLWLSWFVKYDPNWKNNKPADVSDRINPEQAGNW